MRVRFRHAALVFVLTFLAARRLLDAKEPMAVAIPFTPPVEYAEWWVRTERCSGLKGYFSAVQFYVVPGRDVIGSDGKKNSGMWWRMRDGRQWIILAGDYVDHEMVVRHEMLHSLIGLTAGGHPPALFEKACHLTWETWPQ